MSEFNFCPRCAAPLAERTMHGVLALCRELRPHDPPLPADRLPGWEAHRRVLRFNLI
jgi:hypothetical protein